MTVLPELGFGGISKESVTTNVIIMTARGHFQRLAKVTRHFHDGGATRGTKTRNPCCASALVNDCLVRMRVNLEGRQIPRGSPVSSR